MPTVKALVIGGGGGGGRDVGGGGGGGGYQYDAAYSVSVGSYTVTVGTGGAGAVSPSVDGANGGDSSFGTITANGGGGGTGTGNGAGSDGGCGGGGTRVSGAGGTGSQGGNGGSGSPGSGANVSAAGGGGGASAAGANASNGVGGNGGAGTANSISGSSVTYAGGGGGRGDGTATQGTGGTGGGGNAGTTGGDATDNLGGGGGGGGSGDGGDGGDGVVIIRYAAGDMVATGGVITTDGTDVIHTFNTSGTFTVLSSTLPANGDFPQSGSIVSRWKLNDISGNRSDSVGSNTLTDNNTVTYSPVAQFGEFPSDFEASTTESLSIADASQSGLDITGDLSFGLWIQWESLPTSGNSMHILNKWASPNLSYFCDLVNESGTLKFRFATSSDGTSNLQSKIAFTPTTGKWYHLAISYDASAGEVKHYVNGALIGTTGSMDTSLYSGSAAFYLGGIAAGGNDFDGLMQDVVLWSAELTDAEVEDVYNAYFNLPDEGDLPQSASVVSRWTLTEDAGTRYDQVGSNNLSDNNTVLSGAGISEDNSSAERSADFERSASEYLSVSDNASFAITSDLSFSAWVKFESTPSSGQVFTVSGQSDSGTNQRSWYFGLWNQSGTLKLLFNHSSDGSNDVQTVSNWTPSTGVWYHIAFSYDASAGEVDFYVDGAAQGATQTGANTSLFASTAQFRIGNNYVGDYFDGLIQDAILWIDIELTAQEVSDLYDLYTVGLVVGTKSFTIDSLLYVQNQVTFTVDSLLQAVRTSIFTVDALLLATKSITFTVDADIRDWTRSFTVDALLVRSALQNPNADYAQVT